MLDGRRSDMTQDMTLEGLEDDPNFWNDMDEEEELPAVTAVDLTASKCTFAT